MGRARLRSCPRHKCKGASRPAQRTIPQESDRVAPDYPRGRLTLVLCPGYDAFPSGAPAYEVRDMESAERRRRIAIAAASDRLWNGEISRSAFLRICARGYRACGTRHSFEPETSHGGAADGPRDQSDGRSQLSDR